MSRRPAAALVAGTLLAGVALAGCSSGGPRISLSPTPTTSAAGPSSASPSASATPAAPPANLVLNDCTKLIKPQIADQPGGNRPLTFECGRMRVPVDYAKPDGSSVQMFVVKARLAGQSHRIGSLVINPGGPGGSGVEAAIGLSLELPEELLRRFDLVGFDPRGVGLSDPVTCIPAELKDRSTAAAPDARTAADYAGQVALARAAADACYRKYGDKLAAFNTTDTARDLDQLRRALGDDKLTYLGYSYGTLIGSVYATLFPDKVRALVLDGAVDPTANDLTNTEAQARGFEDAYDEFARDCVRRGCPAGRDPRAFLARLVSKATAHPVPASGDKRTATGGNVLLAAVSALYRKADWPKLSQALADADRGNAKGVLDLDDSYNQRSPDGTFTNIMDANFAVNCADSDQKLSDATIRATIADWRRKYPLFGPALALTLVGCQVWKPPRRPLPKVAAPSAPTILVVGTRHDPATPYTSAQHLARALGHATLLTWNGDGHTAYPQTSCLIRNVDAYLIADTAPKPATTCPAS